jgi:hydroxymethylpyrimidine kinase/phosphomethylpyrimidine kinase
MIEEKKFPLPVALTIAGFDPSGAAGILADARTFAAFDCYPTAVITSITFQNPQGVSGSTHQDSKTVRAQLLPILISLPVACVKTGMLPTREIVLEVARTVREYKLNSLVVDPVMKSSSGYELMDAAAFAALRDELLPLAQLVTPNIPEAEKLIGSPIKNQEDMLEATESIRRMSISAVLLKGGHLEAGNELVDILNNDGKVTVYRGERISGGEFRGTGCTLASAIAASLAKGSSLEDSVDLARNFVFEKIKTAQTSGRHGVLF